MEKARMKRSVTNEKVGIDNSHGGTYGSGGGDGFPSSDRWKSIGFFPSLDLNGLNLEHLRGVLLQLRAEMSQHQARTGNMILSIWDFSDTFDFLLKELNACFSCFIHEEYPVFYNPVFSSNFQDGLYFGRPQALIQDICLLLRCCLITVHLLYMKNCDSTLGKCQILVKILQDLCFSDCLMLPSNERTSEVPTSYIPAECKRYLHCSLLEVFLDELSIHSHVRQLFREAELSCCRREKIFAAHHRFHNADELLELVCRHFILSIDNEADFSKFLHSLFWLTDKDYEVTQLNLETSVSLLRTSVICSVPFILQAHLILLASKNVEVLLSPYSRKSNVAMLSRYISAFDQSINLYRYLLTRLQLGEDHSGNSSQLGFCFTKSCGLKLLNQSYYSYVQPTTYEKINHSILQLPEFFDHYNNLSGKTKEESCSSAFAYFNKNRHVVEEPFRDQAYLFLKSILSVFTSYESGNIVLTLSERNWQEIFCIAAVLKLMTNLLLQIGLAFRNFGNTKNSREYMSLKEYDFLSGIIYSFVISCGNQLVPDVTSDLLHQHSASCDGLQLLLLHIVGLFLCSLECGTEHIWKGCIAMMFPLLNLIILRDGSLDSLSCVVNFVRTLFKETKEQSCRRSSLKIASNFRKAQSLCLQKPTCLLLRGNEKIKSNYNSIEQGSQSKVPNDNQEYEEQMAGLHQCNGEEFLKLLEGCKQSDINDLADFIDCVEGKDYSNLLRNKAKFRGWKLKRLATTVSRRRADMIWSKIEEYRR